MSEINPVCSKCVSIGEVTCCGCKPWIPLTIEDIKRISKILKCDPEKFAVAEERTKEETLYFDEWRLENLPKIDERYYMTCMRKNGNSCIFLKKDFNNGCTLGSNRAFICKLYPFWVNSKNELVYEADDFCYFVKDGVPTQKALQILGESEESIRNYFQHIRQDCIENTTPHKKMIDTLLHKVDDR
ncbi:MAG: hypothetical protein QG670_615 [Thermoproteota archaeon]|nr:hypothetical protein [Thermoproteota archaeon]